MGGADICARPLNLALPGSNGAPAPPPCTPQFSRRTIYELSYRTYPPSCASCMVLAFVSANRGIKLYPCHAMVWQCTPAHGIGGLYKMRGSHCRGCARLASRRPSPPGRSTRTVVSRRQPSALQQTHTCGTNPLPYCPLLCRAHSSSLDDVLCIVDFVFASLEIVGAWWS